MRAADSGGPRGSTRPRALGHRPRHVASASDRAGEKRIAVCWAALWPRTLKRRPCARAGAACLPGQLFGRRRAGVVCRRGPRGSLCRAAAVPALHRPRRRRYAARTQRPSGAALPRRLNDRRAAEAGAARDCQLDGADELVALARGRTVTVIALGTGRIHAVLEGHDGAVLQVRAAVATLRSCPLRVQPSARCAVVLCPERGEQVRRPASSSAALPNTDRVCCRRLIITVSEDRTFKVWDLSNRTVVHQASAWPQRVATQPARTDARWRQTNRAQSFLVSPQALHRVAFAGTQARFAVGTAQRALRAPFRRRAGPRQPRSTARSACSTGTAPRRRSCTRWTSPTGRTRWTRR
jgi:hypothetical protein